MKITDNAVLLFEFVPSETNESIESSGTRQWKPHFNVVVNFGGNRSKNISISCCYATQQWAESESDSLLDFN